ncbi:kielin/chordin-like protein [Hetaerina americana]|uniref:kielin/chordin-like protein n=1 Tax=Hetaerina americana TaxID=62018 RepID=UPI003A7F25C1
MTTHLILLSAFVASLLSCSACGESTAKDNCDKSQCQTSGLIHLYAELNCQPVYQDGACCPVRYDCSSYSSRNANKCHFEGQEYDIGKGVPTNKTSRSCLAACICLGDDSRPTDFTCAQIECAELFGIPLPHPSCIRQYSKDSCCSVATYCPTDKTEGEEEIFQCEYEGKKYIKGQRFYPTNECKTCTCDEGFDGSTNGPWCNEISCSIELRSAHYLRQGCAPVFYKSHCCPVQWRCPSNDDSIIKGPNHKSQSNSTQERPDEHLTCTFGNIKLDLQDKLQPGELDKVDCACITPPYLSCAVKTDD